jgi:F0F1-type ATP synthase delta subunit
MFRYQELAQILADALAAAPEGQQERVVHRFVKAVAEQGGIADTEKLLAACEAALQARSGAEQLSVRVAHGMTVPGADVQVEPELIAGGVASRGAVRADASVAGRLALLRNTLNANR